MQGQRLFLFLGGGGGCCLSAVLDAIVDLSCFVKHAGSELVFCRFRKRFNTTGPPKEANLSVCNLFLERVLD